MATISSRGQWVEIDANYVTLLHSVADMSECVAKLATISMVLMLPAVVGQEGHKCLELSDWISESG